MNMFEFLLAWGRASRYDMEVLVDLNRFGFILFLLIGMIAFSQNILKFYLRLRKNAIKSYIYEIKDLIHSLNSIKRFIKHYFIHLITFIIALCIFCYTPTFKNHLNIFTFLTLFFYAYGVIELSIRIFFIKH